MTGKIIIITAPSGAGKTSITRYLLRKYTRLAFSVSATTRQPRGREVDGVDYYFITVEEFQSKIQGNEFLEWEMVYEGKYYGTLKSELERIWKQGRVCALCHFRIPSAPAIARIRLSGLKHGQTFLPDKTAHEVCHHLH